MAPEQAASAVGKEVKVGVKWGVHTQPLTKGGTASFPIEISGQGLSVTNNMLQLRDTERNVWDIPVELIVYFVTASKIGVAA